MQFSCHEYKDRQRHTNKNSVVVPAQSSLEVIVMKSQSCYYCTVLVYQLKLTSSQTNLHNSLLYCTQQVLHDDLLPESPARKVENSTDVLPMLYTLKKIINSSNCRN